MTQPAPSPRRKMLLSLFALPLAVALLASAAWLAACADGSAAEPAVAEVKAPPPPDGFTLGGDAEAGAELFVDHCAVCHGDRGAGDGKLSKHLRPFPGDLAERVAERTDWQVYLVVRDGGQAVGLAPTMVGFGERFSDQQIRDVTAFVLSLAEKE